MFRFALIFALIVSPLYAETLTGKIIGISDGDGVVLCSIWAWCRIPWRREVILGVEDGLKSKKVVLDSSNKSGLIVELYEHFLPTKKVDMSVINLTLSQR